MHKVLQSGASVKAGPQPGEREKEKEGGREEELVVRRERSGRAMRQGSVAGLF
jgi:hypothetical protein